MSQHIVVSILKQLKDTPMAQAYASMGLPTESLIVQELKKRDDLPELIKEYIKTFKETCDRYPLANPHAYYKVLGIIKETGQVINSYPKALDTLGEAKEKFGLSDEEDSQFKLDAYIGVLLSIYGAISRMTELTQGEFGKMFDGEDVKKIIMPGEGNA